MLKNRLMITSLFLMNLLLFSAMVTVAQEDDHPPHWAYEGEVGADHWGELSKDFALCADGSAQSPINITDATALDLTTIGFDYGETALNIFNNGHTIQVGVDEGSSITHNEIAYNLLQFHFHHPSEHTIDGEAAAMEIHFVHMDPNSGNLAVVGVMLTESEDDNAAYADIFSNLPTEAGDPQASDITLNLDDLLPTERTYFTYNGSLTTPPCSEIVRWLLLDTPVELSAAQIDAFGSIFEANARPVQPLNDRDLFVDTNE
jgi:carbonic anhydrase